MSVPISGLEAEGELHVKVLRIPGAAVVGEGFLDVLSAEVTAHPDFELRRGNRIPARDQIELGAQLIALTAGGVAAGVPEHAAHVVPEVRGTVA